MEEHPHNEETKRREAKSHLENNENSEKQSENKLHRCESISQVIRDETIQPIELNIIPFDSQ